MIEAKRSNQEENKWKCQKGSQNNGNDCLCQINWLHIADTAMAKWASTEREWFSVMRPAKSHLGLVVLSHEGIFAGLYRQNRLQYPPCPIMKMSIKGASTIFGHAFWEITLPTDCRKL
jgi:hypothetical protein